MMNWSVCWLISRPGAGRKPAGELSKWTVLSLPDGRGGVDVMNFAKNRPFLFGLLASLLIAGPILAGVIFLNWWHTPLGIPLGSTADPAREILDTPTLIPTSATTPTAAAEVVETETPSPEPTLTPLPTTTAAPQAMCGGPDTLIFLFTGVDSGNYLYGLSDAIRLVRVDYVEGSITVLPLPRDLWVDIPVSIPGATEGITEGKLNQAYFYGSPGMGYYEGGDQSPGLLANTLKHNFNVEVDRYFSVNTRIFRRMVSQIGGITVTLPENVYGHYFDEPVLYLKAGTHHLNGKQAELVSRHRTLIGDFGRMKNQTILLKAFVRKLLTPQGIKELPALIDIYREDVLLDFSPQDISQLLCLAAKIDLQEEVTFLEFPQELVTEGRIYDEVHGYDAYALSYDPDEIRLLLAKFQLGIWP
jgi:LCP family protein required for cell wall assembly